MNAGVQRDFAKQCVGPGWAGLVAACYDTLEGALGDNFRVNQVKEKFGALRFYWTTSGIAVYKLHEAVAAIEELSLRICEQCGAPGELRREGWWQTLCTPCAVARRLGRPS